MIYEHVCIDKFICFCQANNVQEKCFVNSKLRSPGLPAEQVLIFLLMLTLTIKVINESAETCFKNLWYVFVHNQPKLQIPFMFFLVLVFI